MLASTKKIMYPIRLSLTKFDLCARRRRMLLPWLARLHNGAIHRRIGKCPTLQVLRVQPVRLHRCLTDRPRHLSAQQTKWGWHIFYLICNWFCNITARHFKTVPYWFLRLSAVGGTANLRQQSRRRGWRLRLWHYRWVPWNGSMLWSHYL